MVAALHPAFGMINGDGFEFPDVLDGFAGKNGKERAGADQIQDSVYAVILQPDVQIHIICKQYRIQHIPGLQSLERKRERILAQ